MTAHREHSWPPLSVAARKKVGLVLTQKGRQKTGLFIIDGFRLLRSALESRWPIDLLIVRNDGAAPARLAALLAECRAGEVPVYLAAPKTFDQLTSTIEPPGIMALARQKPPMSVGDQVVGDKLLVADNVRDPGNLGAILRSAAAFGVDGVYLSAGCVELYNPKVVRAAMGAVFGLAIYPDVKPAEFGARLRNRDYSILVADPHEGANLEEVRPGLHWALVIGGETHGYSETWRALGARPIRIPMTGRVESLNSAVAAGILLHCLTSPPHSDRGGATGTRRSR